MNRIAVVALCALAGCTNPAHATRTLNGAGYTAIKMDGYGWLNCSKDDFYRDRFTAVGPTGQPVSGVVCSGLFFKSATIRLD